MLTILLAALALPMLATISCADPAITNATARNVSSDGGLNHYDLAISLANVGGSKQPASVLQSVMVFQNGDKVDQKAGQPLAAGRSETLHYQFARSSEARPHSTHFRFQLTLRDPHAAVQNCSTANDTFRLDV